MTKLNELKIQYVTDEAGQKVSVLSNSSTN